MMDQLDHRHFADYLIERNRNISRGCHEREW